MGLLKADGSLDWSKILGLGIGAAGLYGAANQVPYTPKTPKELLDSLPSNAPKGLSFKPIEVGSWQDRKMVPAASMASPIVAGVRYNKAGQPFAEGGEVEGPLSQVSQTVGLVSGEGGGQDDLVEARLSPGEYVMDAETVSMLGDGDNTAGARKLDELRQQLRSQKRSAPDDEIAPPANGPLSYIRGAA